MGFGNGNKFKHSNRKKKKNPFTNIETNDEMYAKVVARKGGNKIEVLPINISSTDNKRINARIRGAHYKKGIWYNPDDLVIVEHVALNDLWEIKGRVALDKQKEVMEMYNQIYGNDDVNNEVEYNNQSDNESEDYLDEFLNGANNRKYEISSDEEDDQHNYDQKFVQEHLEKLNKADNFNDILDEL